MGRAAEGREFLGFNGRILARFILLKVGNFVMRVTVLAAALSVTRLPEWYGNWSNLSLELTQFELSADS